MRVTCCKPQQAFVFFAASCAFTLNSLVARIVTLFHVRVRYPPGTHNPLSAEHAILPTAINALLLAPIIESVILCALLEAFRKSRSPFILQIAAASAILALTHVPWWPRAVIVAPLFLVCSYCYLHWRHASWQIALLLVAEIHAAMNLIPFLDFVIKKTQGI